MNVVKWWVDAVYALHNDMKSHTKTTMAMGRGFVLSMSRKKNLNTKISIKSELVGADDTVLQMLWTKYFLEAQGYSMVLMRTSCTKIILVQCSWRIMGRNPAQRVQNMSTLDTTLLRTESSVAS